jgi:hypothetical protein
MRICCAQVSATGDVCAVGDPWPGQWSGRPRELLRELEARAKVRGREHLRCYVADLDGLYRALVADGWTPPAAAVGFGPDGLSLLVVSGRCRITSAAGVLPSSIRDELTGDPAELLEVLHEARRVMSDAGADLTGSLTRAAVELVRAHAERWTSWPEPDGGPLTEAAWSAIHAGLVRIWEDRDTVAVHDAADLPRGWIGEPDEVLPPGWTLRDEDRVSAYAAEACRPLPAVHGPAYDDADAPGGALVRCIIDLEGWTGIAIPVRVQQGRHTATVAVSAGKWETWVTSDLIAYARSRGAAVEVLRAYGWKHAAPYLAPGMRALAAAKAAQPSGSVGRRVLSAAMQRTVGALAKREPAERVLEAAELERMTSAELEAARIRAVFGKLHGWALVEIDGAGRPPRGTVPVWTAFVVSRAWVSLCERLEAIRAAGGRPLYCDTDGILYACPPGVELERGDALGAWQERGRPEWVLHERLKLYARGTGGKITAAASAGVPRADLVWYLEGGAAPTRLETVREQAARGHNTPEEVASWSTRKERTRTAVRPPLKRPRKRSR